MGRQIKQKDTRYVKKNKYQKTCERCGNENFSKKKMYKCKYCGFYNGVEEYGVTITRGGIESR